MASPERVKKHFGPVDLLFDPSEDFAELSAYFSELEHLAGAVNDVNALATQKKQEQSGVVVIEL